MDLRQKFLSVTSARVVPVQKLDIGGKYSVQHVERVSTPYGHSILISSQAGGGTVIKAFLPKRYINAEDGRSLQSSHRWTRQLLRIRSDGARITYVRAITNGIAEREESPVIPWLCTEALYTGAVRKKMRRIYKRVGTLDPPRLQLAREVAEIFDLPDNLDYEALQLWRGFFTQLVPLSEELPNLALSNFKKQPGQ